MYLLVRGVGISESGRKADLFADPILNVNPFHYICIRDFVARLKLRVYTLNNTLKFTCAG